jgi:glutamate-1-semialdehyde 2,1-aminomutase
LGFGWVTNPKNIMSTIKSQQLFNEAQNYLVGGVNSPVRSFKGVGGKPLIMKSGHKQTLTDVDGNTYTDYCLSWGALILGHAHRNVILNAKKTIEAGAGFGTTTRPEIDIARLIVERVPSIERVRFVNSGTEATMSAIRLARGFTRRDILIKFDGCYHGHADDLLIKAGSGLAGLKESSSFGIPEMHLENTISLPYNDVKAFTHIIEQYNDNIACVIVEPVAGNMGVIKAGDEFLKSLREQTSRYGIVLIFDEIMTGFRTHPQCVQGEFGIIPDMTCLGKIIGGGFPVGAYGGKKEIMDCLSPLGGVYQAGTFSGNPMVMKAGLETLKLLNAEFYKVLNERCEHFATELNTALKDIGCNAHLSPFHSMMCIRFRKEPVLDYHDAKKAAGGKSYEKLFQFMLEHGIYLPPADLEAFFVSGMHTSRDLEYLKNTLVEFFSNMSVRS